ncbi:MAG: 4-hydroxy-tetrahydrodipicolinate reductase [Bacteroidales bacterium]|nr:4-hydroxy-tetrahydrodipicolinate reductase [Bacteroidales bacterium]
MKISLIGNGKMGKEVIKMALERGHELVHVFDVDNINEFTAENLQKTDVVFEFTQPESAFDNITKCLDAGVPCICGTTGWLDKMEIVKKRCTDEEKTFFYASNFSIGVNILFEINKKLAQLMNNYSNYDVSIEETHHIHKLDAPSGTAIYIANQIISEIDRKNSWKLDQANNKEIKINAVREDEVPGTHTVIYDSDVDFIEIKHSAKNRRGLAFGAVLAAEYVQNKKGFFTMQDLLKN